MDVLDASAANMADWHESWLTALGLECRRSAGLWTCLAPPPPIYHTAITLGGGSREDRVAEIRSLLATGATAPLTVCDSRGELDLGGLGLRPAERVTWMARPPYPAERRAPAGLSIELVLDEGGLEEVERASIDGFGQPALHALGTFGLHAPEALADPRMRLFAGRCDGRVVSVAMAYASFGVVGVYGLATLPAWRRRGFGEALAWAAALCEPDLTAVLQPSPQGASTYRRMGFAALGETVTWLRGPSKEGFGPEGGVARTP